MADGAQAPHDIERFGSIDDLHAAKVYAESIVETIHEPLLVLTPDLRVKSANPAFYNDFEVRPEETIGRLVYQLGNGQWNIPALRTLLEDVLPENHTFRDFEVRHDFEDIGERVMLVNARRLDHVQLILLGIRDITEQARARTALEASEEKYRTLFDSINQGFCIVEVLFGTDGEAIDYRFLEVNRAFERHTGLHDAVGRRMRELEPRHEEHWFRIYGRIARTGEPERFIQRAQHLQGRWYDVYAFRSGPPAQHRVAILFRDISDQTRAEEALRASEARFRALVTASSNVVYRMSADWTEMLVLEGQGFLADTDEPSTSWIDAYIPPDDYPQVKAAIDEAIRTRSVFELEHRVRRADGTLGWTLSRAVPLLDEAGDIMEWFGAAADITGRKRAEEALRDWSETLELRVTARTAELTRAVEIRRQVLRQLVTAEEDERRRISRELHDHFGQQITGLLLGLRALEPETSATARLRDLQRLADSVARDIQSMAVALRPPALDNLGLAAALREHLEDWSGRYSIDADFHSSGVDGVRLPPEVETTLYRVAQEALTNVLKHACASGVSLVLERRGGIVRLILEDDGVGFDVEQVLASPDKAKRLGVRGMRERVALLGGELEIESSPGSGTSLYVRIPDAVQVADATVDGAAAVR